MSRLGTYRLVVLSGMSVLATVDAALGLGGGALLADICRTWLEDEPATGRMSDMMMEVQPVPLITLSLAATSAAVVALTNEHRRALAGRSAPDDEERAVILSAVQIVALAQSRTSPDEINSVFRIVTGHELEDDLATLAYERLRDMVDVQRTDFRLSPVSSKIGRRRTLVAALIVGCVARPATAEVPASIDRITLDIGAILSRSFVALASDVSVAGRDPSPLAQSGQSQDRAEWRLRGTNRPLDGLIKTELMAC